MQWICIGDGLKPDQLNDLETVARRNLKSTWENPEAFGLGSSASETLRHCYLALLSAPAPVDELLREQFYELVRISWWAWWRSCNFTHEHFSKVAEQKKMATNVLREKVSLGGVDWLKSHVPLYDKNFERFDEWSVENASQIAQHYTADIQKLCDGRGIVTRATTHLKLNHYSQCWIDDGQLTQNSKFTDCCLSGSQVEIDTTRRGQFLDGCLLDRRISFDGPGPNFLGLRNHFSQNVDIQSTTEVVINGNSVVSSGLSIGARNPDNNIEISDQISLISPINIRAHQQASIIITRCKLGTLKIFGQREHSRTHRLKITDSKIKSLESQNYLPEKLEFYGVEISNSFNITSSLVPRPGAAPTFYFIDCAVGTQCRSERIRLEEDDPLGFYVDEASYRDHVPEQKSHEFKIECPNIGSIYFDLCEIDVPLHISVESKVDRIAIGESRFNDHFACKQSEIGLVEISSKSLKLSPDSRGKEWRAINARHSQTTFRGHLSLSTTTEAEINSLRAYNTHFLGQFFLRGRDVRGSFVLDGCTLAEFPRLEASNLSFSTIIKNTKFEWRNKFDRLREEFKQDWLSESENALRTLVEQMNQIRYLEAGSHFEAEKHEVRRLRTDKGDLAVSKVEKTLSKIYGVISGYGYSIIRPLGALILTFTLTSLIFSILLCSGVKECKIPTTVSAKSSYGVFALSALNSIRPFYAISPTVDSRTQDGCPGKEVDSVRDTMEVLNTTRGGLFKLVSVLQSVSSVVFIFVFLLAVRRRFQLS